MTLTNADIVWYPTLTGSSEGGVRGGTPITNAVDNNLWPDLNSADLIAGGTRYRKIFVANNSGGDSWIVPYIWIPVPPTNMTESIGIGVDSTDDAAGDGGNFTQFSGSAILQVLSSGADTRSFSIRGLNGSTVPTVETLVLNGTTPVSSVTTWSKVWNCSVDVTSGSRTLTMKQGAGGTVRGTITPGYIVSWVWVDAYTKPTGIGHVTVGPGEGIAVWRRQVWAPATSGVRPNPDSIKAEEA